MLTNTKNAELIEFGGEVGAFMFSLLLPLFLIGWHVFFLALPLSSLWPSWVALCSVIGWTTLQAVLQQWMPGGRDVLGLPLLPDAFAESASARKGGQRLLYRCNGLSSAAATVLVCALLFVGGDMSAVRIVDEYFGALLISATLCSFTLALALFVAYRRLAPKDSARRRFYGFFMGVARNPRVGALFDWKFFFEARPSLFGWLLLDILVALAALERDSAMSAPLCIVVASHALYVLDYLWHEPAILSIHDITTERFGFMMLFGDAVWVPFGFCVQSLYLYRWRAMPPLWCVLLGVACQVLGFVGFRVANSQKNGFMRAPDAPLRFTRARHPPRQLRGGGDHNDRRLLVDGMWCWSRHPNYACDLLLGFGWCLVCGIASPAPYWYVLYFAPTLLHREYRDRINCAARFGSLWQQYVQLVPYRIIPYVY
jgi:Ergosterol biosynthesis ERG4/ERG24 family